MNPIYFAIMAAASWGLWTVFHKSASTYINAIVGAIIVSTVAVITGFIMLAPKYKHITLFTSWKGILFVVLAGVMAFFLDYFTLSAFNKGLPVSIGGPIIIGGSVVIATVIGFFLGESFTLLKIVALVMLMGGAAILSYLSR
jgi:transporter family protein